MPLSDVGASVRLQPSGSSPEQWFFKPGQATVVLRNSDSVLSDDDTWWYVYSEGRAGWVRDSDVRMTAVNVTASELANEIYRAIDTSSHELLK